MTLHRSPITCEYLLSQPTLTSSEKMSLSHIETVSLSHSSPQDRQRSSWKPWLCSAIALLFFFSTLIVTLSPLKRNAKEFCIAKFGPLPSKWQMASPEPPCVVKISDWELKILQNGFYLTYGQVAFNRTYKGAAPFEVWLRKNKKLMQVLTNNSQIETFGWIYDLHAGETIDLTFNDENQVLKNNTYWVLALIPNHPFIS
ncbi:LOW QUALITY PROTEIN: tumor necrosis factor ligand superfamily member 18 [Octodon degus]|uniref:Tumor necrosis factor ligand superfamily member 18 n=1 Tax=Octodon degus TaxID=10160 RepID=A0A6P3EMS2_OCTDE|nr:LOW QUALITY PROTEIN: tumor necrosis factor ligand superfamily member 18 [Octodon degus]